METRFEGSIFSQRTRFVSGLVISRIIVDRRRATARLVTDHIPRNFPFSIAKYRLEWLHASDKLTSSTRASCSEFQQAIKPRTIIFANQYPIQVPQQCFQHSTLEYRVSTLLVTGCHYVAASFLDNSRVMLVRRSKRLRQTEREIFLWMPRVFESSSRCVTWRTTRLLCRIRTYQSPLRVKREREYFICGNVATNVAT